MKKIILAISCLMIAFGLFADKKAEDIMRKSYDLPSPKDQYSVSKMVLIDKKNNKKVRKIEMYTKDTKVGTNSFIRFLEPADVKGTTFLTIGYTKGDDEQRLYLPALGQVKKIASSGKGGKFMGSDLSYYDMEDRDFDEQTYTYLREETYKDMQCHVIETISKDPNCPYSKTISWINSADNFIYKTECYDKKKGKFLKTIVMHEVQKKDGILIATKIIVDNVKDDHKTLLQIDNLKINVGVKDDIFTVKNMKN